MNGWDILLIALLGAWLFFGVRAAFRRRGGCPCCGDCKHCRGCERK